MVRILECAASGVLLVIPEDSHLWRNEREARSFLRIFETKDLTRKNARAPVRVKTPSAS